MFSPIAIFYRPGSVFQGLRKRPSWAAPFLLTVMLTFLSTLALVQLAGMELFTLQRLQHDRQLSARVGEDSIDKVVSSSNGRMQKVIMLARETGVTAAALLCLGMIFKVVAAFLDVEPRPTYWQMLAMAGYAFYPIALIRCVATSAILYTSTDNTALDLDNVVGLNLGALIDRTTANPSMFEIASSMDLLNFAQLLLLAFGFAKTAGVSFMRSLFVCGALWTILILWKAALAAFL